MKTDGWGRRDQESFAVIVRRPPAGELPDSVQLGLSSLACLIAQQMTEDEGQSVGVRVLAAEHEDP